MKTITLNVAITFSEDVSDDNEIKEVTNNVLAALVNNIENVYGLVPADADYYTKTIVISEPFTGEMTSHTF